MTGFPIVVGNDKRKIPPNPSFDELRTGSLLKGGINCKNEMLK
jgi:hypothetical protein